jgi:hypothetical protein
MMKSIRSAMMLLTVLICSHVHAQMEYIPGDILVQINDGYSVDRIVNDLASTEEGKTGLHVAEEVSAPMRIWRLEFDIQAISQHRMLELMKFHPAVSIAQNNHVLQERLAPNDTNFGQQWHHVNSNDADIDSDLAWDITTGGLTAQGDTIVVCVIENSDLPHPDLSDNAWFNHQEIPNNGEDDDNNGYVDDFEGWNPGGNNDDVYGGGHGTQVAGMIGAVGDNSLGVVGANWHVKIMVVTVGSLTEANVIASYTYPWTMRERYNDSNGATGAFVVATNASWGIDGGDPASAPLWCAVYDSLGVEGILSCGATANNAVNVDVVGDLPTACSSDFMVSVTATNDQDMRTFSAYGATTIDVGAPGGSVYTTAIGGGYGTTSGTSFASPLTAGVIGLLYSAPCSSMMTLVKSDPEAGALFIRDALFNGVEQVGNLPGETVTGGRINSHNSLLEIMNNCGACPEAYNLDASATGSTEALFSWTALGTGPYNVRYREVGTTTWTNQNNVINTSLAVSGLTVCTEYEFQVEVFCDSIWSGFGQSAILPIPVEPVPSITLNNDEVICDGDMVMLTSSALMNSWNTGDTAQSIVVSSTGSYSTTAIGFCNNALSDTTEITVLPAPSLPVTSDVNIPGPGTATLAASGDSINWYDAASGGNLVGTGNSWDTPFLNSGTDYWCSNVVTSGDPPLFDGNPDNTTSGQYHTNANNWIVFNAFEAFTIRSVRVYASGAGNRAIGLVNMANSTTITQSTINIPDGQSRVQLDFDVPGPGQYGLRVMAGNPQLWRDGPGSNPAYPFSLGTFGELVESTAGAATNYYYFFYDWEIQGPATNCESPRVKVSVLMPVGMDEAAHDEGRLNVYPNPANNMIQFEISGLDDLTGLSIQIVDAAGRSIDGLTGLKLMNSYNAAALADGLYHYTLERNSEIIASGRFSIAH